MIKIVLKLFLLFFLQQGIFASTHKKTIAVHCSNVFGWFCKKKVSRFLINPFLSWCRFQKNPILLDQFEQPKKGYANFHDFFIRKFKDLNQSRTFDQNFKVVSACCEGLLSAIPTLLASDSFFVKSSKFYLKRFIGCDLFAKDPVSLLIFRLRVFDYHRIHMPVEAKIIKTWAIPGTLLSVQPKAFKADQNPLVENARKVLICKSKQGKLFVLVAVGALNVGSIILTAKKNQFLKKGSEIGYFAPGGSTVVLIASCADLKINNLFCNQIENSVLLGQSVASF